MKYKFLEPPHLPPLLPPEEPEPRWRQLIRLLGYAACVVLACYIVVLACFYIIGIY